MSVSSSRILRTVLREEAFYFFTSIGNYTGQSAASLDEFLQKVKDVNIKSIEFHVYREDFEKWISQTLGDAKLADEIKGLRNLKITGNSLRDRLYFAVSRRLKELKTAPASK
jgi:sugar phosphate isomerase/epimerase